MEVLLVEDSLGDARLTQEAFLLANRAVRLHVVTDGVEAMAFLNQTGQHSAAPRPDLILLDLNLPKMRGDEVLMQIKASVALKSIPTIMLTSSSAAADVARCYELQASCYLGKPADPRVFEALVKRINDFWLTKTDVLHDRLLASST